MTKFFVNRANEGIYEAPARTIDEDRPCENCGYNLRGLKSNTVCPECGAPIRRGRKRATERDFCELPPGTIVRFMPGFFLASTSIFGIAGLLAGDYYFGWPPAAKMTILIGCAAAWFIGLWLMTAPIELPGGANRGFSRSSRLRLAARWLQLGWFVQVAAIMIDSWTGGGSISLKLAAAAGNLGGVVGIVLLAYLLANFAEWVRDDFAERCFNFTFGGLAIVTPPLLILVPFTKSILPAFIIMAMLMWLVWFSSLIAFPLGLWSLSRSLTWAVYHSREKMARAARVAAKVQRPPTTAAAATEEDLAAVIPLTDEHAPDAVIRQDSLVQIDPDRPAAPVHRREHRPDRGASSSDSASDMELF